MKQFIKNNYKIKNYNIMLFFILPLIFYLMYFTMDTAMDRENYIQHFNYPFLDERIEIGFQYYMQLFKYLGIEPYFSIPLTSVFIYLFFYKFWFTNSKEKNFITFLSFNFIIFSLMQYLLGTSIRMGLATVIAIYSFYQITEGKNKYFILLLFSASIHYGVIVFVIVAIYVTIFSRLNYYFHLITIIFASIFSYFFFFYVLEYLNLNSYYLDYIYGDAGKTDRLIPYSIIFYILSIILLSIVGFKNIFYKLEPKKRKIFLVYFYMIPLLIVWCITQIAIIPKIMAPSIFIGSFFIFFYYTKPVIKVLNYKIFFSLLIFMNFIAFLYAFNQYRII